MFFNDNNNNNDNDNVNDNDNDNDNDNNNNNKNKYMNKNKKRNLPKYKKITLEVYREISRPLSALTLHCTVQQAHKRSESSSSHYARPQSAAFLPLQLSTARPSLCTRPSESATHI